MKVRIVGGRSTAGKISILSDEFVATAYSNEDGNITCKVKRHSRLLRFLYKNRRLPVPRVIRLVLFFVSSMNNIKKGVLIFSFGIELFGVRVNDIIISLVLS